MRDYGSVHTRFWSDPDIQKLSDQSKLLALYVITGPHTNMLGCFRLPIGYIAADLGWDSQIVTKCLTELAQIDFIYLDEKNSWVLVYNFLKWNPIENPNQGKSISKLFEQVPEKSCVFKPLITTLLKYNQHFSENFQKRLETLNAIKNNSCETVTKPLPNQNQEQDQKQNQDQDQNQDQSATLPAASVISIPLNNKTEFPIYQNQIDEWQTLYPTVDIIQTLRNIRGWNLANVHKRKTKSGILKHITGWLANEQNRGGIHTPPSFISSPQSRSVSLQNHNLTVAQQWLNQQKTQIIEGEINYDA